MLSDNDTLVKILEDFKRSWFAAPQDTTIMNWDGLIKDDRGFFEPAGRSAKVNESCLKKDLYQIMIEPALIAAYEKGKNSKIL